MVRQRAHMGQRAKHWAIIADLATTVARQINDCVCRHADAYYNLQAMPQPTIITKITWRKTLDIAASEIANAELAAPPIISADLPHGFSQQSFLN